MDSIWLANDAGEVFVPSNYGMLLKSFEAPEPKAKTYRQAIDGMDGDLDMTEWAGVVRYETRTVQAVIRDMSDYWWRKLIDFCHGRNVKITHSSDPAHYYYGRVDATHATEDRVTDVALNATCQPYRLNNAETIITQTVTGSATITLCAKRRPVTPTVIASAQMNLTYQGTGITIPAGTQDVPDLILTDTPVPVAVTGTGTITFKWRDGVL